MIGGAFAGQIPLLAKDPYARVLGWKAIADATINKARTGGFQAIATNRRSLAAEFSYYLRDQKLPVVSLQRGGRAKDHFEMTRPLNKDTPRPILLVSFNAPLSPTKIASDARGRPVGQANIREGKHRTIYFYAIGESGK